MNDEKKEVKVDTPEVELNEEVKDEKEDVNQSQDETVDQNEEKAEDEAADEKEEKDTGKPEEVKEEDEALNTKYLRLMADFQNYKKRVEKEKGDIYAYANEKIVAELLNVIDNFERALQHESGDETYVEGMKMIFKQLTGVLEKAGLQEVKALGEEFDPNFHNAVMMEDNPDYESNKVTEVMQKGYMLNNKVIRPSMVKVNN